MSNIGRAFAFGSCSYVYRDSPEAPGSFGDWFSQGEERHRREANVPSALNIHLVVDNYSTDKYPKVKIWLAAASRYQVHYTPAHAS